MMTQASAEEVKDLFQVFREVPHKKNITQMNNTFKRNFTIPFKGIKDIHSMIKAIKVIKWDVSPFNLKG